MTEPGYLSRRTLWMQKLSDEVVRGITQRIREGDLHTGAPLPDRDTLASEYVTSDGVIDRAIERLMHQGLITPGPEGGFVVAGYPASEERFEIPQADKATLDDVIAVLELRIGIESEAAALAAERRTDAQLAAIRAAAEEHARAERTPARADFAFHLAIGAATGNRYFRELTEYLGPLLIPRMRVAMLDGDPATGSLAQSQYEHGAIVEAIAARDADAARAAMQRHLQQTIERIRALTPSGDG